MKTVLTMAGSDPSGGAGAQSDLKTFEAFGVRGLSAITALTAQNNLKVKAVEPVAQEFLKKQVSVLMEEFTVDAVKIGMIGTVENLRAIVSLIKKYRFKNVVLDTVFRSTSGFSLLEGGGGDEIKKLLPLSTVVTPNIKEAEVLTGIEIKTLEDAAQAALLLHLDGAPSVLIKGGHREGDPVDMLYDGRNFHLFEGKRIKGRAERFHGTGCMLSAAMAAGLAKGWPLKKAVREGKGYVEEVLGKRR